MKLIKRLILFILLAILIVGIVIGLQGYKMYDTALKETPLSTKIEKIRSDENYVTIDKLPKDYINAVVSVEDRRFYKHSAIDLISIGRAIVTNIKEGELVEGGSTITQQLAKNIYFTQKQVITRKVAEIFMASSLEKNYSKDEILELYVNTSYFGDGYYGIREASLGYFDKEPAQMTLDECTLIAGIPNAPSVYAPTKNPDLARKRQKHVLYTMVENKYMDQATADSLIK